MDASLRNEINSCIWELDSVVRQLYAVSNEISGSISGMNTRKFTNGIDHSAERYRRAANKLRNIK